MNPLQQQQDKILQLEAEIAQLKAQLSPSGMMRLIQPILNSFSSFVRFVTGSLEFENFSVRTRPAKDLPSYPNSPTVTGNVMDAAFTAQQPGNSFNHLFLGRSGDGEIGETNYMLVTAQRIDDRTDHLNNLIRNGRIALMVRRDGSLGYANLDIYDAKIDGQTEEGNTALLIGDGSGQSGLVHIADDGTQKNHISMTSEGAEVILTSPNGTLYKITVSDAGTLGTTAV